MKRSQIREQENTEGVVHTSTKTITMETGLQAPSSKCALGRRVSNACLRGDERACRRRTESSSVDQLAWCDFGKHC